MEFNLELSYPFRDEIDVTYSRPLTLDSVELVCNDERNAFFSAVFY